MQQVVNASARTASTSPDWLIVGLVRDRIWHRRLERYRRLPPAALVPLVPTLARWR
jgi:hypothetical protein